MANIKPFRGYRYSSEKIENIADVMAPPYDALSVEETDSYYDLNPYNAVRLVAQQNKDADPADEYIKTRDFLDGCIKDGVLVKEKKPSYYVYEETVTVNRENYYNRGIVALLELTDYDRGIVVPCEEPSTDSKNDRLNLIKVSQSNNSLISCMYTESSKSLAAMMAEITCKPADMDFVTTNDKRHKLWVIDSEELTAMIERELSSKRLFIVDGHNRYEACLEYKKNKMKEADYTGKESFNYVMALISDSSDDGRIHLPVHRLVKCNKRFSEVYLIAGLTDNFTVEKIIVDLNDDDICETMRKQIATQRKETKIAMYTGQDYFYRFTFKGDKYLETIMPDASVSYRQLDLAVLNKMILEEQLGITAENEEERVDYTRSLTEGKKAVDNGEFTCMFVVNPVRPPQFNAMTETGERLPKRSVSIFPKPATGIVIHKFTEDIEND